MLDEIRRVKSKIPEAFKELMQPHIQKVNDAIEPAIIEYTWTTTKVDDYIRVNINLIFFSTSFSVLNFKPLTVRCF